MTNANPNRIVEVYGSMKKPDGTNAALVKTAGGVAYWVLPSEVGGAMPRVGALLDPSKHQARDATIHGAVVCNFDELLGPEEFRRKTGTPSRRRS